MKHKRLWLLGAILMVAVPILEETNAGPSGAMVANLAGLADAHPELLPVGTTAIDHLKRRLSIYPSSAGFDLVDELNRRNIDASDALLRSSKATRGAAGALANLINYLADPGSAKKLAIAYQVWRRTSLK